MLMLSRCVQVALPATQAQPFLEPVGGFDLGEVGLDGNMGEVIRNRENLGSRSRSP